MNSYIKHIVEAFDFNSVNKQKNTINAIDILKKEQLPIIFEHIDKREQLNDQDYFILTSFTGIYKVSNHDELKSDHDVLKDLIYYFTVQFGNACNLNGIDVSNVTDMSRMFCDSKFNGDISKWDVINVTDMGGMFYESVFNSDISNWKINRNCNTNNMFLECIIADKYKPKALQK